MEMTDALDTDAPYYRDNFGPYVGLDQQARVVRDIRNGTPDGPTAVREILAICPTVESADMIVAALKQNPTLLSALKRSEEVREELVRALMVCDGLFSDIRSDYTDSRMECREGREIISAALSRAKAQP